MTLQRRVSSVNAVLPLYPRVQDHYFETMICRVDEGFSMGEGGNAGVTCREHTRLTTAYGVYGNKLGMWGAGQLGYAGGPTRTRTWDRPIMSRML